MKNRSKSLKLLILSVLLIMLAVCAPLPVEIPATPNDRTATATADGNVLVGTAWRLISYGASEAQTPVMEGTEVTLEFEDQTRVGGSAGCNTFGANYTLTAEYGISITNTFWTEKACTAEGVMEQEQQYLDALQRAGLFENTGDTLKIWYEDGRNVLTFSRMER